MIFKCIIEFQELYFIALSVYICMDLQEFAIWFRSYVERID